MININLIAERRARKMREMMILRWGVMSVILAFCGMLLLNVYGVFLYSTAKGNQVSNELTLKKFQKEEISYNLIVAEIDAKKPQLELLQRAQASQGAWMIILADLGRIIPQDVVLESFATGGNDKGVNILIAGTAPDEEAVGQFMLNFHTPNTNWAGNPKLGAVTAEESNGIRRVKFGLTIPVKGMRGGDL